MFKESFAMKESQTNVFYSPQFATMFLEKYITFLSVWTCFERKSNAYAEGNFKDTKKRIIYEKNYLWTTSTEMWTFGGIT